MALVASLISFYWVDKSPGDFYTDGRDSFK